MILLLFFIWFVFFGSSFLLRMMSCAQCYIYQIFIIMMKIILQHTNFEWERTTKRGAHIARHMKILNIWRICILLWYFFLRIFLPGCKYSKLHCAVVQIVLKKCLMFEHYHLWKFIRHAISIFLNPAYAKCTQDACMIMLWNKSKLKESILSIWIFLCETYIPKTKSNTGKSLNISFCK